MGAGPFTIAVVGIDGAGKSTLCRELKARINALGLQCEVLSRWDVLDHERYPSCRFLKEDLTLLKRCIGELSGNGRATLLFSLLSLAHERPCTGTKVKLFDGFWAKHAAAELVRGCPRKLVLSFISSMPVADFSLFLDVDPRITVKRKDGECLNAYECGLASELSGASFVIHQTKVQALLQHWAVKNGWCRLDASTSAAEVNDMAWYAIENHLLRLIQP